jgi:hypothetical protein
MKAGLSDVLLFVIPFFVYLSIFQQSYPIPTYESRDWVMCCSLWFLSLVFFKSIFQQSPPMSRDWVMCCLCDLFQFYSYIFQQSYPFPPMQGLSDVLLFCDSSLCLVLRVFSTVLPISTLKAGIEWCAALCDFLLVWFKSIFQQSTHSTYESRDWVMCCSFVIPSCVWS